MSWRCDTVLTCTVLPRSRRGSGRRLHRQGPRRRCRSLHDHQRRVQCVRQNRHGTTKAALCSPSSYTMFGRYSRTETSLRSSSIAGKTSSGGLEAPAYHHGSPCRQARLYRMECERLLSRNTTQAPRAGDLPASSFRYSFGYAECLFGGVLIHPGYMGGRST